MRQQSNILLDDFNVSDDTDDRVYESSENMNIAVGDIWLTHIRGYSVGLSREEVDHISDKTVGLKRVYDQYDTGGMYSTQSEVRYYRLSDVEFIELFGNNRVQIAETYNEGSA